MTHLVWGASALSKRFAPEVGSDTVEACLAMSGTIEMTTTVWGYAETYSILIRKRNGGRIQARAFREAISALNDSVLGSAFAILPVSDEHVFACTTLMEAHSLNSTDAAILRALLDWSAAAESSGDRYVLISSDLRFLRAAEAEGLRTLNPEAMTPEAATAWLGSLAPNP